MREPPEPTTTEADLNLVWKTSLDKFHGSGQKVIYSPRFAGTEYGTVEYVDHKWVYVRFADGTHKVCPVNLTHDPKGQW